MQLHAPCGAQSGEAIARRENIGVGFFQRCLAKNRGSTPVERYQWREGIYVQIQEMMPLQGNLNTERICQLSQVSRAGFYRYLKGRAAIDEEMEVRSAIQEIATEHRRRYGYRRITAELRERGMLVNHKRVLRIMAEDKLLMVDRRALFGTDFSRDIEVYFNLASRMTLTGTNQLWVADITYIRLQREFVYLAVILDAFSRKVVGWALDRTLASRLPIAALEQAIAKRQPPPDLVHHSDRGMQYSCGDYAKILQQNKMIPSVSRPGKPCDNARCESFLKTLKREEIYANDYRDLEDLLANVVAFIEQYYNQRRLHSALGYRPPEDFEKEIEHRTPSLRRSGAIIKDFQAWDDRSVDFRGRAGVNGNARPDLSIGAS